MDLAALKQAVTDYLALVVNHLAGVQGDRYNVLYVNNYDGKFEFDIAPVVTRFNLVDNDTDLTSTKTFVEQSSTTTTVLDFRDDTLHDWDGSSWTTSTVVRDTVLSLERLYFAPIPRRCFFTVVVGISNNFGEPVDNVTTTG